MSRFSFCHCPECGRLNIYGARCVCNPTSERACDCTFDGNTQNIGPACQQRIDDDWREALRVSHEMAAKIRDEGAGK